MWISYVRLGKNRRQIVLKQIQDRIEELEQQYTIRQIKQWWKKNSLSYDMGISGHLSEKNWDWYDIDYRAGQIIEFKNHVFNDHDSNKLEIYRIMQDMGIEFDTAMQNDYKRALKRKQKYGVRSSKVDNNIEATVLKTSRLFWFKYKKEICVSIGIISLLIGALTLCHGEDED